MGKSEIVNKFLEKGILLSPKLLESLEEDEVDSILSSTDCHLLVLASQKEPEMLISVKSPEPKKTFTVKDFVDYQNRKYNTLKEILLSKLSPISINKLPQNTKSTIIGLVSEKNQSSVFVEDPTGRIEVKSAEQEKIQKNSILGFEGELKEKIFLSNIIFYPDIPLDRKPKTDKLKISLKLENEKPKVTADGKTEEIQSTPSTVSIKKSTITNILVYRPENTFTKNHAVESLKLRCLPEPKIPLDSYMIENVPDILWIAQKEEWRENYRGVILVSGETIEI